MIKIQRILIIVLLIYSCIISIFLFNRKDKVSIDNIYIPNDTIFNEKVITVNKPYKVIVQNIDTVLININDTNCIKEYLKLYTEYNTKKYYKDTTGNDSSMTIIVEQLISRNNLDSLKVYSKNNRTSYVIPAKESTFGLGLQGGYKSLTPYISYSVKDNTSIYGGYDVISKSLQLGINYRFYKK